MILYIRTIRNYIIYKNNQKLYYYKNYEIFYIIFDDNINIKRKSYKLEIS